MPEKPDSALTALDEVQAHNEHGRTRKRHDDDYVAGWEKAVTENIEKALSHTSHIVLLPEFALPPPRKGASTPIERQIYDLSVKAPYNHFIQPGTRHDDRYNRGLGLAGERRGMWNVVAL